MKKSLSKILGIAGGVVTGLSLMYNVATAQNLDINYKKIQTPASHKVENGKLILVSNTYTDKEVTEVVEKASKEYDAQKNTSYGKNVIAKNSGMTCATDNGSFLKDYVVKGAVNFNEILKSKDSKPLHYKVFSGSEGIEVAQKYLNRNSKKKKVIENFQGIFNSMLKNPLKTKAKKNLENALADGEITFEESFNIHSSQANKSEDMENYAVIQVHTNNKDSSLLTFYKLQGIMDNPEIIILEANNLTKDSREEITNKRIVPVAPKKSTTQNPVAPQNYEEINGLEKGLEKVAPITEESFEAETGIPEKDPFINIDIQEKTDRILEEVKEKYSLKNDGFFVDGVIGAEIAGIRAGKKGKVFEGGLAGYTAKDENKTIVTDESPTGRYGEGSTNTTQKGFGVFAGLNLFQDWTLGLGATYWNLETKTSEAIKQGNEILAENTDSQTDSKISGNLYAGWNKGITENLGIRLMCGYDSEKEGFGTLGFGFKF